MAWCGTKKAKRLLKMDSSSILVFDLETTGLSIKKAEILQITITDGNGITLFSSYIRPEHTKKWTGAEKIHGISPKMVENAPLFMEVQNQIQSLFNKAKLVAGYNIKRFDIPLIERYGISVPLARFDVMEEFRLYTGRIAGSKLINCADYFQVYYSPHDATEDARATACCMRKLIEQPGFVKTVSPKVKESKPEADTLISSDGEAKRQPLTARLLMPFLRRNMLRPVIIGILMMGTGIFWFSKHYSVCDFEGISIDYIINVIQGNKITMLNGAMFMVGLASFLYGLFRITYSIIRWTINLLLSRLKKL